MSYPALPNVGNSEEGSSTLRIESAEPSSSTRQAKEDGTPDARPPYKPHPSNMSKWTTLEHTSDLQDSKPTKMTLETDRILSWPRFAYYEILDVEEDAPTKAIRIAYRQKARLVHSDRNDDPQATDAFQSKSYGLIMESRSMLNTSVQDLKMPMRPSTIPISGDSTPSRELSSKKKVS